jgi:hypothetical protein
MDADADAAPIPKNAPNVLVKADLPVSLLLDLWWNPHHKQTM